MKEFQSKTFHLPPVSGISQKTMENHLELYKGYVDQANCLIDEIKEVDIEKSPCTLGELQRRFSFEFNGMRNHEAYFGALEGGPADLSKDGELEGAIADTWGSFAKWLAEFKKLATTRGTGWAILWYDPSTARLLNGWVDEQQIGQLQGCVPLIALDMWEHAYLIDRASSEKDLYIQSFLTALNWSKVEADYSRASIGHVTASPFPESNEDHQ